MNNLNKDLLAYLALIQFNLNDDIGIMNFGTRDSSWQSDYIILRGRNCVGVCAKDVFSTALVISLDINGKLIFITFLYKLGPLFSHFKEEDNIY